MSKAKEFFEELKRGEPQIGAVEAVKEGIQAVAPGLSLSKILSDVGKELKEQAKHGSHELAAALFNGSSFVMYPRQGKDDQPQHGLTQEAQQQEQSHGGREL
jgi:DNA topoisomerase IA